MGNREENSFVLTLRVVPAFRVIDWQLRVENKLAIGPSHFLGQAELFATAVS